MTAGDVTKVSGTKGNGLNGVCTVVGLRTSEGVSCSLIYGRKQAGIVLKAEADIDRSA